MPHVDEGRLHAFLDGALDADAAGDAQDVRLHLEACADCRARLEEARRIREEADALLAVAVPPSLEGPPFQELVARRRARAGGRRRMAAWSRWAWAASVVAAVGLGWWARGEVRDGGAAADAVPLEGRAAAPAGGSRLEEAGAEPDISTDLADAAEPEALAAPPRPAAPVTPGAGAGEAAGSRQAARPDIVQTEPAPARDEEVAAKAAEDIVADRVTVQREQAVAPAPPRLLAADSALLGRLELRSHAEAPPAAPTPAPAPPPPPSEAARRSAEANALDAAAPFDVVPGDTLAGTCWTLEVGSWTPPLGEAPAHRPPVRFRLSGERGEGPLERGKRVTRPVIPVGRTRAAWWEPQEDGGLEVVWTNGFAGVRLFLGPAGGELSGSAETFTDTVPDPRHVAPITARRTNCDGVPPGGGAGP